MKPLRNLAILLMVGLCLVLLGACSMGDFVKNNAYTDGQPLSEADMVGKWYTARFENDIDCIEVWDDHFFYLYNFAHESGRWEIDDGNRLLLTINESATIALSRAEDGLLYASDGDLILGRTAPVTSVPDMAEDVNIDDAEPLTDGDVVGRWYSVDSIGSSIEFYDDQSFYCYYGVYGNWEVDNDSRLLLTADQFEEILAFNMTNDCYLLLDGEDEPWMLGRIDPFAPIAPDIAAEWVGKWVDMNHYRDSIELNGDGTVSTMYQPIAGWWYVGQNGRMFAQVNGIAREYYFLGNEICTEDGELTFIKANEDGGSPLSFCNGTLRLWDEDDRGSADVPEVMITYIYQDILPEISGTWYIVVDSVENRYVYLGDCQTVLDTFKRIVFCTDYSVPWRFELHEFYDVDNPNNTYFDSEDFDTPEAFMDAVIECVNH